MSLIESNAWKRVKLVEAEFFILLQLKLIREHTRTTGMNAVEWAYAQKLAEAYLNLYRQRGLLRGMKENELFNKIATRAQPSTISDIILQVTDQLILPQIDFSKAYGTEPIDQLLGLYVDGVGPTMKPWLLQENIGYFRFKGNVAGARAVSGLFLAGGLMAVGLIAAIQLAPYGFDIPALVLGFALGFALLYSSFKPPHYPSDEKATLVESREVKKMVLTTPVFRNTEASSQSGEAAEEEQSTKSCENFQEQAEGMRTTRTLQSAA